jgi:hypothetical protein
MSNIALEQQAEGINVLDVLKQLQHDLQVVVKKHDKLLMYVTGQTQEDSEHDASPGPSVERKALRIGDGVSANPDAYGFDASATDHKYTVVKRRGEFHGGDSKRVRTD